MCEEFFNLEERNYARDSRVTCKFIPIPNHKKWHWEICDICNGHGKYVNPSIDASGLTSEDFNDDPDFREDYFSGAYDVTCTQCAGSGKIPVNDNAPKMTLNQFMTEAESVLGYELDEEEETDHTLDTARLAWENGWTPKDFAEQNHRIRWEMWEHDAKRRLGVDYNTAEEASPEYAFAAFWAGEDAREWADSVYSQLHD